MILAVCPAEDEHGAEVGRALGCLGAAWDRIDLADFPERGSLSFAPGRTGGKSSALTTGEGRSIPLDEVRAVWWRRPRPFSPSSLPSAEHRAFAALQWGNALVGALLGVDPFWLNHPFAADAAALKPRQLALAREVGLPIPRTLVTSDPVRARAFLSPERSWIYKSLRATPEHWRPTRRVGAAERRMLGAVRHAPVIFQEHVPGVDVRVTVVGRRLFPVEIDARRSGSPDDFRADFAGSKVGPCRLPAAVRTRLLRMTRRLGLSYAAFDLRRRRNGGHVFLEVNPGGQWLGFEESTGRAITDALARLLASAARRPTDRPSPWLP